MHPPVTSPKITPEGVHIGASPSGYEIIGEADHVDTESVPCAPLDPTAADQAQDPDVFRVRLARPRPIGLDAVQLVRRRYESRGYRAVSTTTRDPNLHTFA